MPSAMNICTMWLRCTPTARDTPISTRRSAASMTKISTISSSAARIEKTPKIEKMERRCRRRHWPPSHDRALVERLDLLELVEVGDGVAKSPATARGSSSPSSHSRTPAAPAIRAARRVVALDGLPAATASWRDICSMLNMGDDAFR
jgi:hypothetical protein